MWIGRGFAPNTLYEDLFPKTNTYFLKMMVLKQLLTFVEWRWDQRIFRDVATDEE